MFINDRVVRANVEAMNNSFKITLTHYRNHMQRILTEFYRANYVDQLLQDKKLSILERALKKHTALYFQQETIKADTKRQEESSLAKKDKKYIETEPHKYTLEDPGKSRNDDTNNNKRKKNKRTQEDLDSDSDSNSNSDSDGTLSGKDDDDDNNNNNNNKRNSDSSITSDSDDESDDRPSSINNKNPVIYSKDPHLFDKREYGLIHSTKKKLFGLERTHAISIELPIAPFSSLETLRDLYLTQVISFETFQTKSLLMHGLPLTDANTKVVQLTPKDLNEMVQSTHGVRPEAEGSGKTGSTGGAKGSTGKRKSVGSMSKSTSDKQISSRPSGSNSGPNAASSGTTKSKKKLGE
jgi:hypothetical protein